MNRRIVLVVAALTMTLVGIGAVYAYAASADRRATAGQALVPVLIASDLIPAGTAAKSASAKVTTKQMPKALVPKDALVEIADVDHLYTGQAVLPGEVLIRGMFTDRAGLSRSVTLLDLPAGKVAMSVDLLDRQEVGRFVRPGDFVAIYATSNWNKDTAQTHLLFRRVQVLAVGLTSTKADLSKSVSSTAAQTTTTVMTVAVDIVQGESLAQASETGALNFALEDAKTVTAGSPGPIGNAQVFGGKP